MMQRPSFGEHEFEVGMIVESWRLWEGFLTNKVIEFEEVSDWRLDTNYFIIHHHTGRSIGAVVAQGASFAVDALERFIGNKSKAVIRIGTCGAISPKLEVGDIVVPYVAIRQDGTSRYYLAPDVPALADYRLAHLVAEEIGAALDRKITPSLAWTTDGRWRQADETIRNFSDLGVSAVDMETSGLLAAAWMRKVAACSVSVVGDTPIRQLGNEFKGVPQSETDWYEKIVGTASRSWEAMLRAALRHIDEKGE
jgi:uridine phosphorylase